MASRRPSRAQPSPVAAGVASRREVADPASRLDRDLGDLFDRLFAPLHPLRMPVDEVWHPYTDVYESETAFIVRMELAGVDRSRLEVIKDGRRLVVRGFREDPLRAESVTCHQLEISQGAFERVLCLPVEFAEEAVGVRYGAVTGFLEITIEKQCRRRIQVQVAEENVR